MDLCWLQLCCWGAGREEYPMQHTGIQAAHSGVYLEVTYEITLAFYNSSPARPLSTSQLGTGMWMWFSFSVALDPIQTSKIRWVCFYSTNKTLVWVVKTLNLAWQPLLCLRLKKRRELWGFQYLLTNEDYAKKTQCVWINYCYKNRFSWKLKPKDRETQHYEDMDDGVCSVSSAKAFY